MDMVSAERYKCFQVMILFVLWNILHVFCLSLYEDIQTWFLGQAIFNVLCAIIYRLFFET